MSWRRRSLLLLLVSSCSGGGERRATRLWVVPPPGPATGVTALQVAAAARKAADLWATSCNGCSLPKLAFEVSPDDRPVRRDGVSVLRLQPGRWCPQNSSPVSACYDSRRMAIAHVYSRPATDTGRDSVPEGEVDLRINAVDYSWSGEDGAENAAKLEKMLVHEVGHLLGLAHSCRSGGLDDCTPRDRDSVMYPYPLEAGHRHPARPTSRDIAHLRELYPPRKPAWGCAGHS